MRAIFVPLALLAVCLALAAPAGAAVVWVGDGSSGECAGVSANSVTVTLSNCIKWGTATCDGLEGCQAHYVPRCDDVDPFC